MFPFRSLFRQPSSTRYAPRPRRGTNPLKTPRRRLELEALEDRRLLNTHPLSDLPLLDSNPQAPATLYLRFLGNYEQYWGGVFIGPAHFGGYSDVRTPVFDEDGDPNTFSDQELDDIREIWQRVAEDFAPFNINISTVNSGNPVPGRILRAAIGGTSNDWLGKSAGGDSYVGSFNGGNNADNTVFAFLASPNVVADEVSHESGHAFGLEHQSAYDANGNKLSGNQGEYNDNGNSAVKAPLMGNSYSARRSIWWNGPNSDGANHIQDDMAIIAGPTNGFGFRPKTPQNSMATAVALPFDQTQAGVIVSTTDADYYRIQAAGTIQAQVAVAPKGPNLAAKLELRDQNDQVLTSVDADQNVLTIKTTVQSGTYYLVVRSHGNYGDVGQYTVSVQQIYGPRVVQEQAYKDYFIVTFDKPIDVSTFTMDKYTITDQAGNRAPLFPPTPVAGSNNESFVIHFRPFAHGGYRLTLGPNIQDTAGNLMDQNHNSFLGESGPAPGGDQYVWEDFQGPKVTSSTAYWGHIHVVFDKDIDASTMTTQEVRLTDLQGNIVPVTGVQEHTTFVTGLASTHGWEFEILVPSYPAGGYKLTVGPDVSDVLGNQMDQNGNGIQAQAGIAPQGDQYYQEVRDTTAPQFVGITDTHPWFGITVQFSKSMNASQLSQNFASAVSIRDNLNRPVPVTAVNMVPFSDGFRFDIRFAADLGHYTLTLGPNIFDIFNNRLDRQYTVPFQLYLDTTLVRRIGPSDFDYRLLVDRTLIVRPTPGDPPYAKDIVRIISELLAEWTKAKVLHQLDENQLAALAKGDFKGMVNLELKKNPKAISTADKELLDRAMAEWLDGRALKALTQLVNKF